MDSENLGSQWIPEVVRERVTVRFIIFESYYYVSMAAATLGLLFFLWAFKKKDPDARS